MERVDNSLYIGSHVSMSVSKGYVGSVLEALSYGASTFMFYTGAPQNTFRKPLKDLKIKEGRALIKEAGIDETKIVVHAPYVMNLANDSDLDKWEHAISFFQEELRRTEAFGATMIVLHPGAHVGKGDEYAIATLGKALDKVLSSDGTKVRIAIEHMAGKGSEIGTSFDSLFKIINSTKYSDRVGVCLDTCHMSDSGRDLKDVDAFLKEFDEKVGLNKLLCLHINDSKNPVGAHKDRHENIGYGAIGFETLNKIVNHPLLKEVPKILETPYINDMPPYKKEIEMFRSQTYIQNWREEF